MFAAVVALSVSIGSGELLDAVDVWEHNTVVCPKTGHATLTQEIWWRFECHDGVSDYFVAAWRLDTNCTIQPQLIRGEWVGTFRDGKDKVRRTIRAKFYWDTESTADFEVLDRQRLPESKRSGLKQR